MEPEPTATRPRHLALVGLMGAGKTAVGASVAADLGRRHVDLDRAVTQLAGRSVGVIFHESGEQAFRDLEEQALGLQMDAVDPVVLSTGGGVLGRETNRDALARGATVVWLRAAPETLAARVGDLSSRPLLADGDPVEVLRRLDIERTPAYEAAADLVVDTDGLDVSTVGALVLDALPATDGAVQ